ncbi:MAG: leucine-rich repeat protein, partial [Eubacteriales bacterium]|nr:leucine-rich repeat protein [Eubacteriales bacterium]
EEMAAPDSEAAEALEEMEAEEESTHDYEASAESGAKSDDANMKEQVLLEVDQDYTQTGEELGLYQYLFTPAETGTYMIELKKFEGANFYCKIKNKKTGGSLHTGYVYLNESVQKYYVDLENNTTYEVFFDCYDNEEVDSLSEIQCTWNIQKISDISLELNKQYTHSTGDLICYEFTPKEDGLYQLTYDKNVEYEIFYDDWYFNISDIFGYRFETLRTKVYMYNGYYVCALDKDESYRIIMRKPFGSENEVENCTTQMRMLPLSKIEKADKVYQKAKNEPAYYQFTADKAGRYLIEGIVEPGTKWWANQEHAPNPEEAEQQIVNFGKGDTLTIFVPEGIEEVCVMSEKSTSDGLEYVQQLDGTIAITGYNGEKKEVVVPDKIDGINVTTINPHAFYKSEVISVQLPTTLKEICRGAFHGCSALSNLTLPDTIERCAEGAFGYNYYGDDENYAAWYKNLPDGEVYIGKTLYAYKGTAPEGMKVTVKPGTVYVNDEVFKGQTGVSEVILPDGLKEIGSYAFSCGKNLKSIVIPASVTEIGWGAVGYGSKLTEYGVSYNYKLDDFVIYGQKGSAAEEYAIKYGFEFVGSAALVRGDVDQSGKVDISDLRMMLRYVCGKVQLTDAQIQAGDVVGKTDAEASDGKVTIADLRKLLRFICGKLQTL